MFVITGGGSGIGRALAEALAARQQNVLVVGRRKEALDTVANTSQWIQPCVADITTPSGRETLCAHLASVPALQGLIHNAGTIEPILPLTEVTPEAFHHVMSLNLEAPLYLTQMLYAKLATGRVLHIGSGAAYFPVTGWSLYCMSKAALSMLTRCWQLECPDMAVASVMPGIVDTPMQAWVRQAPHMDAQKQVFFRTLAAQQGLISADTVGLFLCWLLLDIDTTMYGSQEWDIYDTTSHAAWLTPPHRVPPLEP